jgi:DNA-binding transcriptional LysR family regulator
MELRHLRYFTIVAEEKHFGRAARRLQMAQPPLSRQIQALEAELGFRLFDRSRRGVALTPAGAALLARGRGVFDALDQAVEAARRAHKGEIGRVAIGYVSSLAYVGLSELLRAFRVAEPDIDVVVREGPPQEQIEALVEGRLDVGFVRGPVHHSALIAESVRREELVAVVPAGHRLARRRRVELAALASEPFVVFPRGRSPGFFDTLMGLFRGAGFTPRIVQEAPLIDLMSLVAAGFGVAVVPASLERVAHAGLAFRSLAGAPRADLLMVRRTGDQSPALARFVEVARKRLR